MLEMECDGKGYTGKADRLSGDRERRWREESHEPGGDRDTKGESGYVTGRDKQRDEGEGGGEGDTGRRKRGKRGMKRQELAERKRETERLHNLRVEQERDRENETLCVARYIQRNTGEETLCFIDFA
jgi:hypothetical protein